MSDNEYDFGAGNPYAPANQSANVSFGNTPDQPVRTAGPPKDISTADFMPDVIEASARIPVLVDFWAPWCEPCKQLTPVLEKVVAEFDGAVQLVKMDIEAHPEVAGQMEIQSIPAVVAFVDGKPADAFMGNKTETEIREFIKKLAGEPGQSQADALLEQATEFVAQNAVSEAANLYASVLQLEPDNAKAIGGLGNLYVAQDNLEAAKALLAQLADEQLAAPEIASVKSAIELAEQAAALGDTSELQARIEKKPDDHQARLDLAVGLSAANRREEAADHLLEIIRRKPGWNEDAARVQLLQFFEAWGMTDEATVSARRKLSSILFS